MTISVRHQLRSYQGPTRWHGVRLDQLRTLCGQVTGVRFDYTPWPPPPGEPICPLCAYCESRLA